MGCLYEKIRMSFRQIYKLTKRFFKKIEYKEKKNKQKSMERKDIG
jgi:hypothetical protein